MSTFNDIVAEGNVLVDFHATWCQPCKILGPILVDLAKEWDGKVKVIKIDVDRNPAIAQALSIQGVPTMMLYVNGKPVWRQSGVLPKHELKAQIEAAL